MYVPVCKRLGASNNRSPRDLPFYLINTFIAEYKVKQEIQAL